MSRTSDEELAQLVREKGEQYWLNELKKARAGVFVYAAVFVIAVAVAVVLNGSTSWFSPETDPRLASQLSLVPWVMVMCATIYIGATQVRLLPFMNSNPLMHWVVVSMFAVVGCGAPLWLAMFAGSNSIAKRRLNEVVATLVQG